MIWSVAQIRKEDAVRMIELVPVEFIGELSLNGHYMLGAFGRYVNSGGKDLIAPAVGGALCFSIDQELEEGPFCRIDYIRVDDAYRNDGCAKALITNLVRFCNQAGVCDFYCDIPSSAEYDRAVSFFTDCGFVIECRDRYSFNSTLSEWTDKIPELHDMEQVETVFGDQLSDKRFEATLIEFLKLFGEQAIGSMVIDKSGYDERTSLFVKANNSVIGCILSEVSDDGSIRPYRVLLSPELDEEERDELAEKIALEAILRAEEFFDADTQISFECLQHETSAIVSKCFPEAEPVIVRRAYIRIEG